MEFEPVYVLDYQGRIGQIASMQSLLDQHVENCEMGQNTYHELNREENVLIFKELDNHTDARPDKVLFLYWW